MFSNLRTPEPRRSATTDRVESWRGNRADLERLHCPILDLKGCPTSDEVRAELNREMKGLPGYRHAETLSKAFEQIEQFGDAEPILILLNTYEQASDDLCKVFERWWFVAVRLATADRGPRP